MKKYYLCVCLFVFCLGFAKAQQLPQPTQYLVNPILVNPAYAGTTNDAEVKFSYRSQFNGYVGAPQSFFLSADVPLFMKGKTKKDLTSKTKQALGGYLMYDKFGVLGTFHAQGIYSVHVPLAEKFFVGVGASFGYANYTLDRENLVVTNYSDPLIYAEPRGGNLYGNIGLTFYSEDFFVGVSSNLLKEKNANFFNPNIVESVHQAMLAYKLPLGDRRKSSFALIPSVLLRMNTAGLQTDMNLTVKMADKLWGGVTYRGKQGLAFLAGVGSKDINFTYSYDYFRNSVISGVHEITLGYKIKRAKESTNFRGIAPAKLFF